MFKVVEKWGGGKLMIVKKGLNHIRWEPVLVMFLYLDAERHETESKIAICSV